MDNPLLGIAQLGQSVWCDDLGRELLRSGELKRIIDEDGITGVTSNPTIFEKSISGSKVYDHDLHDLVDQGKDVLGIYEGLVITDIQEAADLLLPIHEKSEGADGFVSLEVSPELAYEQANTIAEARRLHALVNRKNLMIKIPATPQGLRSTKELIGEGISVNVTLVFSLDQYRGACRAYMDGIDTWISAGGDPRGVASVASFFVSRVDSLVDERLQEMFDPSVKSSFQELLGKAAIANAKMAYALYKEIFHGDTFAPLKAKGARPQRIVWASTSTKNPAYPDTYYVDGLLGPETVTTVPLPTLAAFRDHGKPAPRLDQGLDEAEEVLAGLEEEEISVIEVMDHLLEKGVKSFADSFQQLLENIGQKRTRLLRGWGHRSASIGSLQKRVDETLNRWDKERTAEKIWLCETDIWKSEPEHRQEISQRLGWLHIVETMIGETRRLNEFVDEVRASGLTHAVLLGMGGSSLAAEVFVSCYGIGDSFLGLDVLDTTVPRSILEVEGKLDPLRTLFIVSSKSGGTIEVVSLFKHFWALMEKCAPGRAGEHFIAITDPGTSLGKTASEHRFRKVFLNPPDIGGRFSALSYFGLVPAALIGVDLDRMLMRAAQSVESSGPEVPALENPGVWLGTIMAAAALSGMDKLSLIISPPMGRFGLWLEQLIAESTGKEAKGVLPIDEEEPGQFEDYGNDRLFVYLRLDGDSTYDGFVSGLEKAGHPVVTLRYHGPYDLGREIFRWEFATTVAGAILGINPFDQPNVQESKDLTKNLLNTYRTEGKIPSGKTMDIDNPCLPQALGDLMSQLRAGDYVGFNAFIYPSAEAVDSLQAARALVRRRFKTATTLGFGPRYLHSTGQIHKGGPNSGVFIQITMDDPADVEIPGEPYSFGVLKASQALGDYQALEIAGRRIIGVNLASESDLGKLVDLLKGL